jgi:hypothetical protein
LKIPASEDFGNGIFIAAFQKIDPEQLKKEEDEKIQETIRKEMRLLARNKKKVIPNFNANEILVVH